MCSKSSNNIELISQIKENLNKLDNLPYIIDRGEIIDNIDTDIKRIMKKIQSIYRDHFNKYSEYINRQAISSKEERCNLILYKTKISIKAIIKEVYNSWCNLINNPDTRKNCILKDYWSSNLIGFFPDLKDYREDYELIGLIPNLIYSLNNFHIKDLKNILEYIIKQIPVFNSSTYSKEYDIIYHAELININYIIQIISEKQIESNFINEYIKSRIGYLNSIKEPGLYFFETNKDGVQPCNFFSDINLKYFTKIGLLDQIELFLIRQDYFLKHWEKFILQYGSYGKKMFKKYVDHLKKENALEEYKKFIMPRNCEQEFIRFPSYLTKFIEYRKKLEGINTDFEYPQLLI